ncbi:MAG: J domain-containing protein [Rhodospirillaceae bacterium]|jgi:hypothetical protein|nr:J domain-containing protein [Rhodospirillaceae bacterium]MBT6116772.1 J domain-containing protein [Rhodospirillaceae bacterium]
MHHRRSQRIGRQEPEMSAALRPCDHPGCAAEAEFRAPRSRSDLRSYLWFCLEHIRQYNRAWNYFEGMNDGEIENQVRRDTVWERPTWPFAGRQARAFAEGRFSDPLGAFSDEPRREEEEKPRFRPSLNGKTPEERALAVLEIEPPITVDRIKARYKELVKRHHPDANGGDKHAEERLKKINEAYATLKNCALLGAAR